MEKSANARDQHVTWPRGLLNGGSLMVGRCHVTGATTNSRAVGASSEGQDGGCCNAIYLSRACVKRYAKCYRKCQTLSNFALIYRGPELIASSYIIIMIKVAAEAEH